jgi:hypothetical protein
VQIRPSLNRASIGLAVALSVVVVAALFVAGARSATLVIDVNFTSATSLSATLPDGTPLGTTSGAPTVIPAGVYTLQFTDTAGYGGPQFDLQGPGVDLTENLFEGEVASGQDTADLAPNSTYTWRDDQNPSVVFTFTTSGSVAGTGISNVSSANSGTESTGGNSSAVTSTTSSVVGTAVIPHRGTLVGSVSAKGALALAFLGKRVTSLKSGRYTVTITDASKTSGFTLQETNRSAVTVTGAAFVGKRTVTVDMTAGQWFFYPSFIGKKTYFIVVT